MSAKTISMGMCASVLTRGEESNSLLSRLLRGAMWSIGGAVLARGLGLVGSIAAARILGAHSFGELGMIQNTTGMFGSFAGLGLGLTATKHVAEFRKSDPARTGRIIGLSYLIACLSGLVAAIVLLLLAPWLAQKVLAAPQLERVLRMSVGLVLLGAITGVQAGVLAGFEAFRMMAKMSGLAGVVSFPLFLAAVWWGALEGAVLGLGGALLITSLLNHRVIRRTAAAHGVKISCLGARRELSLLGSFSFFVLLGSLMGIPINWVCNSILVHQPLGYEQMGIFNAANQWRIVILFVPGTIGGVVLPMMANLHGERAEISFQRLLRYSVLLNAAVASLIALPLVLFTSRVLQFYGTDFRSGHLAFVLLTLAAVILAVNNGISRVMTSVGAVRVDTWFHVIWGAIFLATSWLLVPRFGVSGLAGATFIGALAQSVSQWAWLFKSRFNRLSSLGGHTIFQAGLPPTSQTR
jgi:O-antigen/teichoic acid export membrane protein